MKILTILSVVIFSLYSCQSATSDTDESSQSSGEQTSTLLTGTVSSSIVDTDSTSSNSTSNSITASLAANSSFTTNNSSVYSNCKISAVDPDDNSTVYATTTSNSNGEYKFSVNQLDKNTTYKIVSDCDGVKLSNIAIATESGTTANLDPRESYIAQQCHSEVARLLVELISSYNPASTDIIASVRSEFVTRIPSFCEKIRTSILESDIEVESDYPDVTSISNFEATLQSKAISESDSSIITQMSNDRGTHGIPEIEDKLDSTSFLIEAQCDPDNSFLFPEGTSVGVKIVTCFKALVSGFVLESGESLVLDTTSSSVYSSGGSVSCPDGFGFENNEVEAFESNNLCYITPRETGKNRNLNDPEDPFYFPDGFVWSIAYAMYEGYEYTLKDINDILFNYSIGGTTGAVEGDFDGDGNVESYPMSRTNTSGLGGRIFATIFPNDYTANAILTQNGFEKLDQSDLFVHGFFGSHSIIEGLSYDTSSATLWNYPTPGDLSTTRNAISSSVSPTDIIFNRFDGEVPDYQELKQWIYDSKVFLESNPTGEAELEVVMSEARDYGDTFDETTNSNVANPCEDDDADTECTTESGATSAESAIKIRLVRGFLRSGDFNGFKYIRNILAPGDNDAKNYYLEAVYDEDGATGSFRLINVGSGKYLKNKNKQNVLLQFVNSTTQCDDIADSLENNSVTLNCSGSGSYDQAIELWENYDQSSDGDWGISYITPTTSNVAFSFSYAGLTTILDDVETTYYNIAIQEEDAQFSCDVTFSAILALDTDLNFFCSVNGSDSVLFSSQLPYIFSGDQENPTAIKFDVDGNTVTQNSSGSYFAFKFDECNTTAGDDCFLFYKITDGDIYFPVTTDTSISSSFIFDDLRIIHKTETEMETILGADTADEISASFFHTAPVDNPTYQQEFDPWVMVIDGKVKTFGEKWDVVDYVRRALWTFVDPNTDEDEDSDRRKRCSFMPDSIQLASGDFINLQAACEDINGTGEADKLTYYSTNYEIFEDPIFVDENFVFDILNRDLYVDWSDSRIFRRSDNAYEFSNPDQTFNMLNFAFNHSYFDGESIFDEDTRFNSLQAFTFIVMFLDSTQKNVEVYDGFNSWGDIASDEREYIHFEYKTPFLSVNTGYGEYALDNLINGFYNFRRTD